MHCVQRDVAGDELASIVAALTTTRQAGPLPLRYRPLIGMLASPSVAEAGEPQGQVMGADVAGIQAILDAGGEVRLVPPRLPLAGEETIELVLQTVLAFDGLFLLGKQPLAGQNRVGPVGHLPGRHPASLFEWWGMLMALVARQTLTPLFCSGPAANLINLALGGTVISHQADAGSEHALAGNGLLPVVQRDPCRLERCLRGAGLAPSEVDLLASQATVETCGSFEEGPEQLAPAFLAWQWADDLVTGSGYAGPEPWFALATLLPVEREAREEASLAHCLFHCFLEACHSYAGSLHEVLRSTRMRDLLLRKLYRETLSQPFLQEEPPDFKER